MAEYPYDVWGDESPEGWRGLIAPLIELCKQHNVRIAQIKQKFGGLRFYLADAAPDVVLDAIEAAELAASKTCEVCGEPGTLGGAAWLSTLCSKHREVEDAKAD